LANLRLSLQYMIWVFSGCRRRPHLSHSLGDPGQHLAGLGLAVAVPDSVVGVALEHHPGVGSGQPRVERVVHEQVRQHRRHRRPCGVPRCRAVSVPSGCCSGAASHRCTYSHRTSVCSSTAFDHPVVSPAPSPACSDRIQRRTPRAISVGIRVEDRFDLPLQMPGIHGGSTARFWFLGRRPRVRSRSERRR
jgi:hypothetical protein